ncbi:type II toxin-antitoxin system RelE/ParE family toxin [Acinetobacter puyangensis]|uniref:type II toxin-antitoxin system RelE/ParE family toxin n=1 Tax=Acinetobacter puyangensis TaxID=1096779 RepID=UPI003A4D5421
MDIINEKITFLGDSLDCIREFPDEIKQDTGYELHRVQCGEEPTNFKPMKTIGKGVMEIRLKDSFGIYHVIYTAKIDDMIYVFHAFQKKTQKTSKSDIELAKTHYKQLLQEQKDAKTKL